MAAAGSPAASQAVCVAQAIEIPTQRGRALGARLHTPDRPVASVIVHGATAVPQRFYAAFAETMAELGLAVLTYDYRGIGLSVDRPCRDDPVTMADWIDDAAAAQTWLAERYPALPLLGIGHSFGGQIGAAVQASRPTDAMLLVGAQSGYYRSFPAGERERLWLTWRVGVPALTRVFGCVPRWAGLGEALPAGVAQQWARWCLSPDYFVSELPQLAERIATYQGRVLALSFTDDEFAPRQNVQWLNRRFSAAQLEHRHLAPSMVGLAAIGHFGLFRKQAKHALWPLAAAFFQDAAVRGHGSDRGSRLLREIMTDLDYGR